MIKMYMDILNSSNWNDQWSSLKIAWKANILSSYIHVYVGCHVVGWLFVDGERDRRERRCEKAITSLLVRKWARPAGRRAMPKHWPATVRPLPLHHQDPKSSQLSSVGLPRPPPALDRWNDLHQKPRRRKGEEEWQYTQMSDKAWVIWAGGISAFISISPFFISF